MSFLFREMRVLDSTYLQEALDAVALAVNNVRFVKKAGITTAMKQRSRGTTLLRRQMQNIGVGWHKERVVVPPEVGSSGALLYFTSLWSPVGAVGVNQGAQTDGMSKGGIGANGSVSGVTWTLNVGAYQATAAIPAGCIRKYVDHSPATPPTVYGGDEIFLTLDTSAMTLGGQYYNVGGDIRSYTHICRPVWDIWLRAKQVP